MTTSYTPGRLSAVVAVSSGVLQDHLKRRKGGSKYTKIYCMAPTPVNHAAPILRRSGIGCRVSPITSRLVTANQRTSDLGLRALFTREKRGGRSSHRRKATEGKGSRSFLFPPAVHPGTTRTFNKNRYKKHYLVQSSLPRATVIDLHRHRQSMPTTTAVFL